MSQPARPSRVDLPRAPLTAPVVRRLLGWSQVRVAALAGTSVSTVRIFELSEAAVTNRQKRIALASVYEDMRQRLLSPPTAAA